MLFAERIPLHQLALEFGRIVPAAVLRSEPATKARWEDVKFIGGLGFIALPQRVNQVWPSGRVHPSVRRLVCAAEMVARKFHTWPMGGGPEYDEIYGEYDSAFDMAWPVMTARHIRRRQYAFPPG